MPVRGSIDSKVMGDEPDAPIIVDPNDVNLVKILNWYNYFYDIRDSKKWIIEWMKKNNYTKEEQEKFERCPDQETSQFVASISRMLNRGALLPDIYIDRVRKNISHCISFKREKKEEGPIFERDAPTKLEIIISEIDSYLDKFYKNYKFFDPTVYDLLTKEEPSAQQSSKVLDYYESILNELLLYREDAVIREAYDHLTPSQLNSEITFLKLIVSDIKRYREGNKVERVYKPRKKKVIPPEIIVKDLKYLKADENLNLKSVEPKTIVGASQIWLYNNKYKKLTKLTSSNQEGLTIKGTTIINFDEKQSESRSLRKPDVVLAQVLQATKPQLRNIFTNLTTKPAPITGRVNEDTILLRVIK